MSKNLAKKVSVSLPENIIEFIDEQGKNRSKTLVTIIQEYKLKKEEEELKKAYSDYSEFFKNDDDFEKLSLTDLQGEIEWPIRNGVKFGGLILSRQ